VDDLQRVPSAQVLANMTAEFECAYVRFMRHRSERSRESILALPYPAELDAQFLKSAQESLQAQQQRESSQTVDFETFRAQYLQPTRLQLP
jgi:glutamate--cysteine ligase